MERPILKLVLTNSESFSDPDKHWPQKPMQLINTFYWTLSHKTKKRSILGSELPSEQKNYDMSTTEKFPCPSYRDQPELARDHIQGSSQLQIIAAVIFC